MENALNAVDKISGIDNLEPASVWDWFKKITAIPRGSGNETEAMNMLSQWAEVKGYLHLRDATGNMCIKIPGSKGCENLDPIGLQGHMDGICAKLKTSNHDFSKDPINIYRDGNFVKARDTTLTADNGIGVSAMLSITDDPDSIHPPLELIVTVEEETGLKGAKALDPKALDLKSSKIINVDCEGVGKITISSAGSFALESKQNIIRENIDAESGHFLKINLSGLPGGHSGTDINDNRGNAIISMSELLKELPPEVKLLSLNGGEARNAIPLSCEATIFAPNQELLNTALAMCVAYKRQLRTNWNEAEISVDFLNKSDIQTDNICNGLKDKIYNTITSVPNGIVVMHPEIPDLVQTSSNLGVVKTDYDVCQLECFIRSSVYREMEELRDKISDVLSREGFSSEVVAESKEWVGDTNSTSVQKGLEAYKNVTGEKADLIGIHAGLEIGILTKKLSQYLGKQAEGFSFGPEIKDAHSPKERVDIQSVKIFYEHLRETLRLMTVQ